MSSKKSTIIDNCTEEKEEICKKQKKLCNPKSTNKKDFCFNDTEKNRKKKEDLEKKLQLIQSQQSMHKEQKESHKKELEKTLQSISLLKKSTHKEDVQEPQEEDIKIKKTKKTILDFIKELRKKKYKTAENVIDEIFNGDDGEEIAKEIDNNKSKKGFIYELLWDICIKFNITKFTNKNTEYGIGNSNVKSDFKNINDYFDDYLKQGYISSNSGGYSDITFRKKEKEDDVSYNLNLVSVKYIKDSNNIKKYDIQNLCPLIAKENENYNSINTLLFVKDKDNFKKMCKKANKSSDILIKYISPNGNYENVYDLSDLEDYYKELMKILSDFNFLENVNDFKEKYLNIYKKKFIPRFHQELFIEKISDLIKKEQKNILVGAIPRSGKTFIMAGTILADVIRDKENNKKCFNNYVIITPAPNETLNQYYQAFDDYYDFANNDIVAINVKDEKNKPLSSYDLKGEVNKHNVFLISKQRLGFKDKEDNKEDKEDNADKYNEYIDNIKKNINKYFGKSKFKLIFLDEAHFGMSTKIAKTIFKELDKDKSYKIYVTATYNKPKQKYDIYDKNIIKWDLIDIKLIKNLNIKNFPKVIAHFIEKFGTKILTKILKNNGFILLPKSNIQYESNINVINNIINQYKHFPEPILLTSVWDKDFFDKELEKIGNNKNVGFDMLKLFMVNESGKFKNNEELTQLLEYYFGYYVGDDGRDKVNNFYEKKYEYKKTGIIPIIEEICTNNCRTLQPQHKTTQLWFLPAYNISKITKSLIELLKTKFSHIFKNYIFYIAVDKKDGNWNNIPNVKIMGNASDIKTEIENLENELLNAEEYKAYEGLIILAGNRLQLGISLKNVDIVSLFTNLTASDAIYQMLFRSMTEIEDDIECDGKKYCGRKKYGFMVDLNPQRTLYTIDYLSDMYLDYDKHISKDKKYELIADLINIDKHKFIDKYNREDKDGHRKYIKKFFNKLYNAWDAKTEDIKNFLLEKNIFNSDFFQSNNDITKLFKIEIEGRQNKKPIDNDNENEIQKGAIKKKIADIVKPEKTGKKLPSTPELWAYLFAEIISILSLITSYTDEDGNECSLNIKNNDNFIYELDKLIKSIDKDTDLKDIFLHTLIKRIIIKGSIKEEELYNMIKNAMYNISQQKKQSGSGRCSKHGGDLLEINKKIQMIKKKIYTINEPDKLLKFINENLKPKKVEKRDRGEVFTPMELVGEMLDTLPKEVWKNPDLKWLDPSAGMGNFPVAVYMRLMKGLNSVTGYENDEKRRKHILENMLYMVEIDKTNVFMMRKIFCGKIYKLNIFEGSFIEGDYNDVDIYSLNIKLDNNKRFFDKIKKFNSNFDIIVGNPPYNNKKEVPIYNKFIIKSLDFKPSYLLFIVPSRWFSGGKGLDSFRRMMLDRTDIKLIKHFENSDKVFGNNVDIKGGVNYFLIDKNYNGLCNYNGEDIKLNKYDILINNLEIYKIIDKLIKYDSLRKLYRARKYDIETNDERLVDKKYNMDYIKCYVSKISKKNIIKPHVKSSNLPNNLPGYKYINKKTIKKGIDISKWKVITPVASGKGKDGFGNLFIGCPNEVHTGSYISFEIESREEAESLLSYLKCDLPNYMFSIRKISITISEATILWVPLPPLDRIWNNNDINDLFKLTKYERKIINTIKVKK
jgi:site-specific DNA-methyltransferase (adenine-specific)